MLTVPDENSLIRLRQRLSLWTDVEEFREPDFDDELTAIAVAGPIAAKRLSHLPLLLREEVSNSGREHVLASGEGRCPGACA